MAIPAFGHGELEWVYEKAKDGEPGKIRVKYALPWEHPDHTPVMNGSATFYSAGKTTPIDYVIRHVPAYSENSQIMTSADGKLEVTITANGSQANDLYIAIVQGYPPREPFTTAYEIVALRVPELRGAVSAHVENFRYPWGNDPRNEQELPGEYTVAVRIPTGSELCRWLGWKRPLPTPDMEEVEAEEMTKLRKLGVFMIEELHEPITAS